MILSLVEVTTKKRVYFAGYDPSRKGFCMWTSDVCAAVNINSEEHIEQLRRYLVLNSFINCELFRFEVICKKTPISSNYIKNIIAQ